MTKSRKKKDSSMTENQTDSTTVAEVPAETPAATPVPTIRADVPMPQVRRGASEKYPFDALPAPETGEDGEIRYHSFPVIGKEAKSLQSTVYSAIRRYATEYSGEDGKTKYNRTRDFKVYNVDSKTDPDGASCRVFRVA